MIEVLKPTTSNCNSVYFIHFRTVMVKHNSKTICALIFTGPEDVQMIMALALADMELTDHNKASLFEGGVLGSLLHLLLHGDAG